MLLTTALLVACSLCQLGLGAPVPSPVASTTALTSPVPCRDGKSPESKLIVEYRTLEDLFAAVDDLDDNDEEDDDDGWLVTRDSCFIHAETVLKAISAPALAARSRYIGGPNNTIERRGLIGALEAGKEAAIWLYKEGKELTDKLRGKAKKMKPRPKLPKTRAEWGQWVKKYGIDHKQAEDARKFEQRKYLEGGEMGRKDSYSPEENCDGQVGWLVGSYGYNIANAMIAGGTFAANYGLDSKWSGFKELYNGFQVKDRFTTEVTRNPDAIMDLYRFMEEIRAFRQHCPKGKKSIIV